MHPLTRIAAAVALAAAVACARAEPLTPALTRAAVEELATLMERDYLFPDVGRRYADELRSRAAAGEWDALSDPAAAAAAWESALRAIQADAHLSVRAVDPAAAADATMTQVQQSLEPVGEGRWLAEGVAYLPIQLLPGDPAAVARMGAFLDAFEGAHTLILDLRSCLGGTLPVMDELFARLYREPARLVRMDMRDRASDDVRRMFGALPTLRREEAPAGVIRWDHWALPRSPAGPWANARVFVLTDVTASACEHLAYALKLTGRATLVGNRTRGGGHFGGFRRFAGQFEAFVPVGRTYDVASGLGWESTGVQPDIAVVPDRAPAAALAEAGVEASAMPDVPAPRLPVRIASGGGAQKRYGIALAPPRGGETSLPILDVPEGSIAARAGLRRGDLILRMNGTEVAKIDAAGLPAYLRGSPLELVVERDGAELTVRMSLDDEPAD